MYWKFVTERFCNKGLISDLILLGEADAEHSLPGKKTYHFFLQTDLFDKKIGLPRILATQ